jgi:Domain of unknown function (DUF4815)
MLNFNVDPYRDDFDPNKHFHRILFKPGKAVQARELTQSQTILQDQISKFASHVFAQNTPVSGGQVTVNLNCYYLKLLPVYEGVAIDVTSFLNRIITDDSGTVLAKVIAVSEQTTVGDVIGDPPTLIVSYISGQQFENSETIYTADSSNFVAKLIDTNSSGKSSTANISEGVFFVVNGYNISNIQNPDGTYSKYTIGHFVGVQPQTIILDKYNNEPSLKIGLSVYETVYDYVNDVSLLDPAIGSSNYQAPGADRYVINLSLETRTPSSKDDQSFIELTRVDRGIITRNIDSTVYSVIDEYFAQRTSETNGDFVTVDFNFTPKPDAINSSKYNLSISKGVAYVNGFRVENQSEIELNSERARTYSTGNSSVYFEYGSYFYVDNLVGVPTFTSLPKVDIHCVTINKVNTSTPVKYNSTLIGTAVLRHVENFAGDVYKEFVTEIQTNTITATANTSKGTFDTTTIYVNTGNLSNELGAYNGVTINVISGRSAGDVRTVIEYDPSTGRMSFGERFTEILDNSSVIMINFGTKDSECIIQQGSSYSIYANINRQYGKERGFEDGNAKLISAEEPEMIWPVGYPFVKSLDSAVYSGTYVFSGIAFTSIGGGLVSTQLNIQSFPGCTFNGEGFLEIDQIKKNFIVSAGSNQVIEFDAITSTIEVESTANKTCTITIPDSYGTANFTIAARLTVNDQNTPTTRSFKYKNLYRGNTSSFIQGTQVIGKNAYVSVGTGGLSQVYIQNIDLVPVTQTQSLYVSDVKKIVKILDTKDKTKSPNDIADFFTNSTYDVTGQYTFNNNQKDAYYDHSYIKLNFGSSSNRGNLLVIFDFYEHENRLGYICGRSYTESTRPDVYAEILNSKYIAKNGDEYKLTDAIDFRPARDNGTTQFVFSGDYIVPDYLSTFVSRYEYYLARKDLLVITKSKTFEIVNGIPSINPVFPPKPEGSLDLAKITLDPYTAYITGENSKFSNIAVQKIAHKTWKMKNISDLEARVNNIEYYTSLSILEKNANDLQIQDSNGLNRFKYGILADDFTGFSVSETSDFDFNCSINKLDRRLYPAHTVFNYQLSSATLSRTPKSEDAVYSQLGFKAHNNGTSKYFTLNYTTANVVSQVLASRTINVNPLANADRVGDLNISPTMDTYVDNLKLPSLLIHDPAMTFWEPTDSVNVISQSDWKLIPGTLTPDVLTKNITTPQPDGSAVNYKEFTTYWKEDQTTRFGNYQQLNANFVQTNDFITDINIMPYVRNQRILFKAENLLVNTPLNCYFDNTDVNKYIQLPNLLKVVPSDSKNLFSEGDAIGYFNNAGAFIKTGTVLDVANVLNRTTTPNSVSYQVLYVIDDFKIAAYANNTNYIVNATVTASRSYIRGTKSGKVESILNNSGIISQVVDGSYDSIDLYTDETGRDYRTITKADQIALYDMSKNGSNIPTVGNVYYPSSVFASKIKTITRYKNVTKLRLEATASLGTNVVNDFYKGAIINISNETGASGSWVSTGVISAYYKANNTIVLASPITFDSLSPVGATPASPYTITRNTTIYRHDSVSPIVANTRNNPISFSEPMPLMSSINGMFCGFLNVPGGTFYSGTKIFRIDNGITKNANSATTYAEATFFAANLATQSQSLQFGSVIPGYNTTKERDKSSIRTTSTIIPPPPRVVDPLAQTFLLPDSINHEVGGIVTTYVGQGSLTFPNGAYLSSISLFFRTKSIDNPVSLFLMETTNGYPDLTKPLENSIVVKNPSDINVSERPHYLDNDTKTVFTFKMPIYIKPGALYAFGLKSMSTDYTVWIASQNDFVLASTQKALPTDSDPTSTEKLSGNPYLGAIFESQNAITWTADQKKSIMFVADACQFDVSKTPTIDFVTGRYSPEKKNAAIEDIYLSNSEEFVSNTGFFLNKDIEYDAFNVSTLEFVPPGASVSYSYDTTPKTTRILTGTKKPINPGKYGTPITRDISLDDGNGTRILNPNTNSSFILTATISSTDKWVSPIVCDEGTSLFTTNWLINDLGIYTYNTNIIDGGYNYNANTLVSIVDYQGYGSGATANVSVDNAGTITSLNILESGSNYAVRPKVIVTTRATANSYSNTVLRFDMQNYSIANGSIFTGQTVTNTANSLQSTTIVYANNSNGYAVVANSVFGTRRDLFEISGENPNLIVNCETCPNTGNGLAKYITKKVTLAEGQEAGDLRVYYTAYRPLNTNVYVYYKILSGDDNREFEDGSWQIMTPISAVNKFSISRGDIIEYVAAPGINNIANNNISYTNIDGNVYTTFNQFAIKVVLMTRDKTYVPFLNDIRAIALPSGTGA